MGWRIIIVKLRESKIDNLQFHWDHKAAQAFHLKQLDPEEEHDLERYFDWLEEIKPCRWELRQTKIFDKPFTLGSG